MPDAAAMPPPTARPDTAGGSARPDRFTPLVLSELRHQPLVDALARAAAPLACTRHFRVWGLADGVAIAHRLGPATIDNAVAGWVADELLPALPAGGFTPIELFEGAVGAIVRSVDASERTAWRLFYDNTLAALLGDAAAGALPTVIADFRAIHREAARLVDEAGAGSLLDVATCFGFLPLALARADWAAGRRRAIVGCDRNRALVALAGDYAEAQRLSQVAFVEADVLAEDFGDDLADRCVRVLDDGAGGGAPAAFDCVTAIHLLEHLAPEETAPAVDHLWGVTRRRLIIAVPFEATPDPRFGHRQVFDRSRLAGLGRRLRGRRRVFECHGGWLVVDRVAAPLASSPRVQR
jgi:hypothetical protein